MFATGLAAGLGSTVELEVDRTPDGREAYLVTVRWEADLDPMDEPAEPETGGDE